MANDGVIPNGVSNWDPKTPTKSYMSKLEPNAKDNPDSISATNEQKQFLGKSYGTPGDKELGKKGRNF